MRINTTMRPSGGRRALLALGAFFCCAVRAMDGVKKMPLRAVIRDFRNRPDECKFFHSDPSITSGCPSKGDNYGWPSPEGLSGPDYNLLFYDERCDSYAQGLPEASRVYTGVVEKFLDADLKPVCNRTRVLELFDMGIIPAFVRNSYCFHFDQWYRDGRRNVRAEATLPDWMPVNNAQGQHEGLYTVEFLTEDENEWFPLDCNKSVSNPTDGMISGNVTGWLTCEGDDIQDPLPRDYRAMASTTKEHNYMFTTEMVGWFTYNGAIAKDEIRFEGDDDMYVFINGVLVIDLGGVHRSGSNNNGPGETYLMLDEAMEQLIGLEDGKEYMLKAFHAERCTVSSMFKLSTTCDLISGTPPTMQKDPHVRGFHGEVSDFKGKNDTVYALHAARHLQVNVRFVHDTFHMGSLCESCGHKTVHGSKMSAVYMTALSPGGVLVRVSYDAARPSRAALEAVPPGDLPALKTELAVSQSLPDADEKEVDGLGVVLKRKHEREASLTLTTPEYIVSAASRFYPWAAQNENKKMLDISVVPRVETRKLPVAPHGLLGQTDDRDNVAVDGARDDYSGAEVTTKAMAEGAIEGQPEDYEISRSNPFSTDFKYARFYKDSAPVRDVSKLSGVHRRVTLDTLPVAGADTLAPELQITAGA